MAGLQGLPQPEEQIDAWQRAWTTCFWKVRFSEKVQADTDITSTEKAGCLGGKLGKSTSFSSWTWSSRKQTTVVSSPYTTDLYKTARYKALLDLLARLPPGWDVEIQTYTVGI